MIGGDETYEARCIKCYELPDHQHEVQKRGLKSFTFYQIKCVGHFTKKKDCHFMAVFKFSLSLFGFP